MAVTSGDAIILGTVNGFPSDHVPAKSPNRSLWKGLLRVLVQSSSVDGQGGNIVITASSIYGTANVTILAR